MIAICLLCGAELMCREKGCYLLVMPCEPCLEHQIELARENLYKALQNYQNALNQEYLAAHPDMVQKIKKVYIDPEFPKAGE